MSAPKTSDRASHFGEDELTIFRNLVENYRDVILNKKTDCVSVGQKDVAWKKVTDEFNATSGKSFRTVTQMKNKFNNMRKAAKKDTSTERKVLMATGGGPPPPNTHSNTDWICDLTGIGTKGRASAYDCDSDMFGQPSVTEMESQSDVLVSTQKYLDDISKDIGELSNEPESRTAQQDDNREYEVPACFSYPMDFESTLDNNVTVSTAPVVFDTSTPKAMLRKPPSKALQTQSVKEVRYTPKETRKRICTLSAEKADLVKCKKARQDSYNEYAAKEHEAKMSHFSFLLESAVAEEERKKQLHELEIAIKKKQLEYEIKKIDNLKHDSN